jgi:hypothetical protein
VDRYVNPDAFARPDPYTFGNAPRTLPRARAPRTSNFDFSVLKNFYVGRERARYVQFRAEAFNLTNSPMFAAPDMTVGSARLGFISTHAFGQKTVI